MHRIGLKLWNINIDDYYNEAKHLFDEKVYDYIELYIVPNNQTKIPKWKELNIPFDIHAAHSAYGVNLSNKNLEKENFSRYLEAKEYADALNASVIIFHGGINGDYKETARQILNFNDSRILIENKPYRPLKMSKNDKCIGSTYEEIEYIINTAKCGFCLDIGHAVCSANSHKIDPYSYIKTFTRLLPKRVHLSDLYIDSTLDQHLNYGNGNLDFNKVLDIIPKNVSITIETNKKSKHNLEDYKADVSFLKKMYG